MEIVKKKNAVGYIRVSTERQAGEDKYGVDAQRKEILDYADKNGYVIIAWFQDSISGVKEDRPEFNKILYGDDVTNPPFEAVIVFKNDRVARDTKLYFYYLYTLEKKNIRLISVHEKFDEDNDLANVYRSLMLFVAEQERKNIALRTGNGRTIKAAAGGYSGGRVPFGYSVSDGRLIINENEAAVVRLIFSMKGKPYMRIADWLNENDYHTRSGGQFYASSIKGILENEPTYRGMYRYGRGKGRKDAPWVKGIHEPILTD